MGGVAKNIVLANKRSPGISMLKGIVIVLLAIVNFAHVCMLRSGRTVRMNVDIVAKLENSSEDSVARVAKRVSAIRAVILMRCLTQLYVFHVLGGDSRRARVRSSWRLGACAALQWNNDNPNVAPHVTRKSRVAHVIIAGPRRKSILCAINALVQNASR